MPPRATTLGNLFACAGYATCITGKWQPSQHLGLPKTLGFDEHCFWQHTRRPPRYVSPGLEAGAAVGQRDPIFGRVHPDVSRERKLRLARASE